MITEWLFSVGAGFVSWLGTLVPSFDPPAWFTSFGTTYNDFFSHFDGFGVWANWTVIGGVLTAVLGLWGVVLTVRLIRFLWGLTPWSGGS